METPVEKQCEHRTSVAGRIILVYWVFPDMSMGKLEEKNGGHWATSKGRW